MIKAVIFDMDGVLIEAKEWHYEAFNKALRLFGFEINRYEHLTAYDGLPTRKKLEMLTKIKGLPIELHDFINTMKQIYTMEMVNVECKPRFHHEYALAKLKERGLKLGVASNSIRNTVHIMMERSGLLDQFECMLSNEDVEIGKPNPGIYIKAMKMLEVAPEETMIIEDNENGITAAKGSGAHVMAIVDIEEVNFDNIMRQIEIFEGTLIVRKNK